MGHRLSDLNDHLFDQLARLADKTLKPEEIETECERTRAIVSVADRITGNADLQLKAARLYAEHGAAVLPMLPQIGKAAD